MTGVDAMFDAMQREEGLAPRDIARQNRNPLNLRGSAVSHTMDARGYCVFADIVDGTEAGIREIMAKVTGHNAHSITPDSTLDELFDVYAPRGDGANNPNAYAVAVAAGVFAATGRHVDHTSKLRDVCPELFPTGGSQ